MTTRPLQVSLVTIFVNTLLFALKLGAALLSGSLAILSDSLNSLLDVVSSVVMYVAIKVGKRRPDSNHPFGHQRAEPLAAMVIAILAGILSFEILRDTVISFFDPSPVVVTPFVIGVVVFSILTKIGLVQLLFRSDREGKSPALLAARVDSRNDVLASSLVLVALFGSYTGLWWMDQLAAIAVALWIAYSGFEIANQNLKYLMGEKPGPKLIREIRQKALHIEGVDDVNLVRAQYTGNVVQVEIHIKLKRETAFIEAHRIEHDVTKTLKRIPMVYHVFVHLDPG